MVPGIYPVVRNEVHNYVQSKLFIGHLQAVTSVHVLVELLSHVWLEVIDGQVSSMNVPKASLSGQLGTADAGICKMALAFCLPVRILAVRRDSGKQCHCATILVPLRKTSMWFSENHLRTSKWGLWTSVRH